MPEVVTVETRKPVVQSITLKLTASEATEVQEFVRFYYRTNFYSAPDKHPAWKAINDALTGVKPKLDGISVANGKVSVF